VNCVLVSYRQFGDPSMPSSLYRSSEWQRGLTVDTRDIGCTTSYTMCTCLMSGHINTPAENRSFSIVLSLPYLFSIIPSSSQSKVKSSFRRARSNRAGGGWEILLTAPACREPDLPRSGGPNPQSALCHLHSVMNAQLESEPLASPERKLRQNSHPRISPHPGVAKSLYSHPPAASPPRPPFQESRAR
jgi:hypothetical protein